MKLVKRATGGMFALVLSTSSLLALNLGGMVYAANNCTWTGATNASLNTAGNWSNCGSTTPQPIDTMVFNLSSISMGSPGVLNLTLGSNISVAGISMSGTNANIYGVNISGAGVLTLGASSTVANSVAADPLEIDSPITLSGATSISSANSSVILGGAVGGSGTVSAAASSLDFTGNNTFTGGITVTSGSIETETATGFGAAANTVTVNDGADVTIGGCNDSGFTVANPLTLTGASSHTTTMAKLMAGGTCSGGGGGADESYGQHAITNQTYTLSGAISLGSDVTFGAYAKQTTLTGALSGAHAFTLPSAWGGQLIVSSSNNNSATANGTYTPPPVTADLTDNQPTHSVQITNANVTIDGTRGDVTMNGGTLNGTGTVNSLGVGSGTVAPGHSPGKLTILTTLNLTGGTYQAELKNKTDGNYDQLVVGNAADSAGHDVTLGDGTNFPTLDVELYSGASIKAGDTFTIINNLSQTAVQGHFNGLPEGATFKVGNGTMKISYAGGDGNDVVLTALSSITAPDTGFAIAAAHPGETLAISTLAAGILFGIARRTRKLAPARAKTGRPKNLK